VEAAMAKENREGVELNKEHQFLVFFHEDEEFKSEPLTLHARDGETGKQSKRVHERESHRRSKRSEK
jgi:hypothetical protein